MPHTKETTRERWEKSGLAARIGAVEVFAINHGFKEWDGMSIPDFIEAEKDLVREEDREEVLQWIGSNLCEGAINLLAMEDVGRNYILLALATAIKEGHLISSSHQEGNEKR